jgi:hypothetical protein
VTGRLWEMADMVKVLERTGKPQRLDNSHESIQDVHVEMVAGRTF